MQLSYQLTAGERISVYAKAHRFCLSLSLYHCRHAPNPSSLHFPPSFRPSLYKKWLILSICVCVQLNIQRLSFEEGHAVETLEEAKAALSKLLDRRGRIYHFHKWEFAWVPSIHKWEFVLVPLPSIFSLHLKDILQHWLIQHNKFWVL